MRHDILVQGVSLAGVVQTQPAMLQMNCEDFPARFLTDLSLGNSTPGANITALTTSSSPPVTLYQPVHRILHVALLELACDTLTYPRLDPRRVDSAGVVIRRVVRKKGVDQPGVLSAWMRSPDGQFQWTARSAAQLCDDPDPARRPQLQSGQPELDRLLSLQTLGSALTEVSTPGFVAPPEVCDAAGRTLVYAVVPTASPDVSTSQPLIPQFDPQTLANNLPTLLQQGAHTAPAPGMSVNYQFMSDDYAQANAPPNFLTFSLTLRMLYTVFGAFEGTPQAASLIAALNKHFVSVAGSPVAMGAFYQQAAGALIDYVPGSGGPIPSITMPSAWDGFSSADETEIVAQLSALLQLRSSQVLAPMGRFQDATRLYQLQVFLRIKSEMPGCDPQLVWSTPSDPFRIAAWHESAGRTQAPVPLPDPFDPNFRKSAKPNCFFAVPPKLMNAMQGTTLSGLSSGSPPGSSGGLQLSWICGFSIPLITICAFFVLNIFLTLLNIVFFWLPFIKICIPFPTPTPANSGDADGT